MHPFLGVIGPGFLNQVPTSVNQNCLVLSREWIMETIIGDYIGTTIGIHSPIPY